MAFEQGLPGIGVSQEIGQDATRCLQANHPKNWIPPKDLGGTDDYGLDFQVQLKAASQAAAIFRLQLKGTRRPQFSSDRRFISIGLSVSTLRFYRNISEPILLVVCDLSVDEDPRKCPMYFVWVRPELRRIGIDVLDEEQQEAVLRVPTSNALAYDLNLLPDVQLANELAEAGHALDVRVEQTHPGMLAEDRVEVVSGIATGISSRSASFIDALAGPAEEHWVKPAVGTLAWQLMQAKDFLRSGSVDRASGHLRDAEELLFTATSLEKADFWFLTGKLSAAVGSDDEASEAFKRAHAENPIGKYLAAWAESEVRHRYEGEGPQKFPDLLQVLDASDDPLIMSAKSRILAAEGRFDEALEVANNIVGPERFSADALANTMRSEPEKALTSCEQGLALADLPENSRQLLLLLKARAAFSIAQNSTKAFPGDVMPPSGAAGIDGELVKNAWVAINAVIDVLREAGWPSNVEHIADIWPATASMLGKQDEILQELTNAARKRPHLPNLQTALEVVAAQCGEFDIALEANDRRPQTQQRDLRRALLLHEAGKHGACIRWFEERFSSFDQDDALFGPAATMAALSAHKLARPDLSRKWSDVLEAKENLKEHAAVFQYFLALELNKLGNDEALRALQERYEKLGRPFVIAVALLQALDPTDKGQATTLVDVASRVKESIEPSPSMAVHIGLAMVTLQQWAPLLTFCDKFKARIDAGPRMLAFEALALDRLGQTGKARSSLEAMLAGGLVDGLALKTYINIMVRCGYVGEATAAAEQIMESASTDRQRKDCVRLLFNLTSTADPASARLLALAKAMGALADPKNEVHEGIYLMMFVTATLAKANQPSEIDVEEFRRRADTFFSAFPDSKIIRRGIFHNDASPGEMLAQLKEMAGFDENREAARTKLENQLQRGLAHAPFSWRPRLILGSILDVVHLWEIAKISRPEDRKYHLLMNDDPNWKPTSVQVLRARTPLLDITALLILHDLGVVPQVIAFFGQVAIAQITLERLAELATPMSGSPMREKCLSLQAALKPHLSSILQPSAAIPVNSDVALDSDEDGQKDSAHIGRENEEIGWILKDQRDKLRLYSDDLAFRIICATGSDRGICTLDVLAGMEDAGLLTRDEVANHVATLCGWRVGLVVRYQELATLLPAALGTARTVKDAVAALDAAPAFMKVISALWDFRAPFAKTLGHATVVLRLLVDQTNLSEVALAAFLGQWYVKAGLTTDAPATAARVLTTAIATAAQYGSLSESGSRKLWSVYRLLVENHHGDRMDEAKDRESIRELGRECWVMHVQNPELEGKAFHALRQGLVADTSDEEIFSASYALPQKTGGAGAR